MTKLGLSGYTTSNASVNGSNLLEVKEDIHLEPESYTEYVEDSK